MQKSWISCVAAALLLFAQYAIAAQACEGVVADDAFCLAHCLEQDQQASSLDQHLNAVPSLPPLAAVKFTLVETQASAKPLAEERLPGGPPLRVLFCSYQT